MKRAHVEFLFALFIGFLLFEAINMALENTVDKGPTSIENLVVSFDDINFSIGDREKKRNNLDRWAKNSINFGLVDQVPEQVLQTISSHLQLLEKITGRTLVLKGFGVTGKTNVTIRYLEYEEAYNQVISKLSRSEPSRGEYYVSGGCRGFIWNTEAGEITKGLVLIVPSDDKKFEHSCIIEELTQVLGLSADRAHYLPAIFSNEGLPQKLSVNDQIMVRTLYDPRLKAGMPREEALVIAKQVIEELVAAYNERGEEALYQH